MAQGHDIATQTENEANMAGSQMGGILGLIDFRVHLRLTQSLNHLLRTQLAGRTKQLPMSTLDDQRIGDSVYRVMYDTTSASLLLEGLTLGLYSGILGVVISLVMMATNYGNAPEVIVLAMLGFSDHAPFCTASCPCGTPQEPGQSCFRLQYHQQY